MIPYQRGPGFQTYRLDLEYDGTEFDGWQLQPVGRTVQGEIESALAILFGQAVRVHAAGRTDAGVHATGQVAHFRCESYRAEVTVLRALNAMLPPDVRVKSVSLADSGFHSRFSAKWRAYRYRIVREPVSIGRQYSWYYPRELDVQSMCRATRLIVGEFSFRAFAHQSRDEEHYLSRVHRAEWLFHGPYLDFHIEANRFLHGMVRFLVGTFVNIGRGKIDPAQVREIVRTEAMGLTGPKAPACGLTLTAVGYRPWPLP